MPKIELKSAAFVASPLPKLQMLFLFNLKSPSCRDGRFVVAIKMGCTKGQNAEDILLFIIY